MKKTIFYLLFTVIIIGVIFGNLLGFKWMDCIFKPSIMVWITLFFLDQGHGFDRKLKALVVQAFVFSWLGDIFLMFSGKAFVFFILGLVSFLIAQLFYIFSYRRSLKLTTEAGYIRKNPLLILPFFIYGVIIFFILYKYLELVLRFAVPVYMIAILSMSAMALNRKNTVSNRSFWLVFIGSLLFLVSDSLLAINKFVSPVPLERLFVLGSYISAQYLIMRGILRQFIPLSGK